MTNAMTTSKDINAHYEQINDRIQELNRQLILDVKHAGERLCSNEISVKEYTQYCDRRDHETRLQASKLLDIQSNL